MRTNKLVIASIKACKATFVPFILACIINEHKENKENNN
jgi:hypothetical protein